MSDDPQPPKPAEDKVMKVAVILSMAGLLAVSGWAMHRAARSRMEDNAVTSNLQTIALSADQYYLDHGVSSVLSAELMGTYSTQYLKTFQSVAGETYPPLLIQGAPVTATGIAGARTITYGN